VFLDRDGVLVEAIVRDGRAIAPTCLEDFHIVQGAAQAVARLRDAGLARIVFTNQPEVARGLLQPETLDCMHEQLRAAMDLDDILLCPHDSIDGCTCRKPSPGMLHAAAARWPLDLTASFVIGDRWSDIEAGRAAGCFTILLQASYSQCDSADAVCHSLNQAVETVLQQIDVSL
jgi:D-glycero-D-manno-heptose 1,7-bisphosphate phosphatase